MNAVFLELPQVSVKLVLPFHVKRNVQPCLLVVAGGREPGRAWLSTVGKNKAVFCADRGAEYCRKAELVPRLLYGDGDSAAADVYTWAEESGAEIKTFQPAKDDTDLKLLLDALPPGNILATGVWGGRFDHLYSNVFTLLAAKKNRGCQVALADEQELMILLTAGEAVELCLENTETVEAVSLLLLEPFCNVTINGVRWPLADAELSMLHPYAISNEPCRDSSSLGCSCQTGAIGLYLKFK